MATILLIEDDPYISAMLAERLTQAGYGWKEAEPPIWMRCRPPSFLTASIP